jgi:flagellar hook-associated protein 3 FlgL
MSLRLATSAIFANGTTQINTLQAQMAKTQDQLSANKRVLTASDDPIASARSLEVSQSQSMNTQFATNRKNAQSSLSLVDKTLQDVTTQIQSIQTSIVAAGNATYTQSDRQALATQLEGQLKDLIGLANTSDGTGGYIFSGYQSTTQPFNQTPTGATYQGDQGVRSLQVGSARKMSVTANGSQIFDAVPTGNGTFLTQAAGANTGSGIVSPGSVTDRSQLTGHNYSIDFAVGGAPAATTYSVMDTTTNPATAVMQNQPYTAGATISFGGMSTSISGAPANGDSFSVQPSQKQSVFTTIQNLIDTLKAPADGSAGKATLSNNLAAAGSNMANALSNVLTVQATVGANLNELDTLDSSGQGLDEQYTQTLNNLDNYDLAKTISMFTQQQQTMQAAQISFKTMSGLSLFNYIT